MLLNIFKEIKCKCLMMCIYSYLLNIYILHNEEALNFYKLICTKIKG